jgi:hypothetical protein
MKSTSERLAASPLNGATADHRAHWTERRTMPEATADAAILIAASYQAMNRAAAGDPGTQLCDCTVTVAFAGFYIEANLNHLIAQLGRENDLKQAYGPNPGLKSKLAFLYAEYIASVPLAKNDVYDSLEVEFPGITELSNFRNEICHGTMNQTVAGSLPKALELRQRAKDIVTRVFTAVNGKTGNDLKRTLVTYWQALGIQPPQGY